MEYFAAWHESFKLGCLHFVLALDDLMNATD